MPELADLRAMIRLHPVFRSDNPFKDEVAGVEIVIGHTYQAFVPGKTDGASTLFGSTRRLGKLGCLSIH